MRKRGFTLVELLATIVVIAIVSLIIFPLVSRHISGTREDLYQAQVENIIKAAKAKALEDEEILKKAKYSAVYVSIEELQTSSASGGKAYLEAETIKNPIDDTEMKGSVEISYNEKNNSYTYRYLTESELEKLNISTSKQAGEYIIDNQEDIYTNESDKSGLFEDAETNTYYFKGSSPENFIRFAGNDAVWKVISIDKKTKEVKIAKIDNKTSSIWSNSGLNDYTLTNTGTEVYEYLNDASKGFKNTLSESIKSQIKDNIIWNIGEVSGSDSAQSLQQLKTEEKTKTITGMIGFLNVSDYVYAATDLSCRKNYKDSKCANNYLVMGEKSYFLMNTFKGGAKVWRISGKTGDTPLDTVEVNTQHNYIPVVILKASAKISSGEGKETAPYIIELN